MVRCRWRYVTADVDRHGTVRYYFRRRGLKTKTRLPGLPGSAEFVNAYQALLDGRPIPKLKAATQRIAVSDEQSLRWLCLKYFASHDFKALDVKTRQRRERNLLAICDLRTSETGKASIGDGPFATMTTKAIRRIHERKAGTPEAANDWLKALKALFKWAVKAEYCETNPTRDVAKFRTATEGFHTWSREEVARFEKVHPIGTTPRLALALLLYTGCRRSDVVRFGPQHIKNGELTYTQWKNRNRKPVTLTLPVLPVLQQVIDATPSKHLTFLVSAYGKPYTIAGFGIRFREWCNKAGLVHCTAHGLRKAGATLAAENGATPAQLMAIFGWSDIKQAEHYTRKADQKRLASDSMHLIDPTDKARTNVSHFDRELESGGTISPKKTKKSAT
jgi:integrase